jgi:CW-type Zinc Finger/Protein SET DOMAIN GROUP 2 C-terminal/SET domain
MALERPQTDPRGYGLLFVDASRKAGHGSSLSHSCAPTCEVRVAAYEGELCLAMTTLRELEMGEELTFDYNAVTESLNEYRSAVCLCGYGKCRGSFLHFATADCYQQVLNRNSPIASRFASLIKGSMKQVMSPDDEQIQRNHGFFTAAFGAISVNRRDVTSDGAVEGLVDSLDIVPVWLRTYVADTLRYIEYERRALPIALICEHLSASKKDDPKLSATLATKEPKPEPSFFYFTRTQADFIRELSNKEGFPESLKGLQLRHALQKVASGYWSSLSDEEKKRYKDQAKLDYEKKMKAWRTAMKQKSGDEKKRESNKFRPEIEEILHSSKISFQDADAEGVVAMEQRIQQLTQTLSRVGRVLDRHREETFITNPCQDIDAEGMRKRVQVPIRVLTDAEVLDWMWNNDDGVVLSLLRESKSSLCVRPHFLKSLLEVREEYSWLENVADAQQGGKGRQQLKFALLKLRTVILQELKEMTKDFRQLRLQSSLPQSEEALIQDSAVFSDSDSEENVPPLSVDPDGNSIQKGEWLERTGAESQLQLEGISVTEANMDLANQMKESNNDLQNDELRPWLDYYADRFVLHAAADLLLLYAYTSNFFVIQPYQPLESTPVEVYARELGNVVPRSVVDVDLASGSTTAETAASPSGDNHVDCSDAPRDDSYHHVIAESAAVDSDARRHTSELCAADDIVAKVTVRYDGDYVTSQLLQWYNAGIGQKPGLPDLLGCALLPTMSDCWSSELLTKSKMKRERKTMYEVKIRPSLVEWMQDPYQRGNPWPQGIKKAFVREGSSLARGDASASFVAFGSPIIDFLVMGDESNITAVLSELDADDKVTSRKATNGLLTSVDKGRPAQAVSTWVQCEHPTCMKWRKIPWFVDADLLPERFFCEDNKWNPQGNNCDAPEDDWDGDDAMVGADGKVEGSPVNKRKFEGSLPVNEESSFRIGSKYYFFLLNCCRH